MYHASTGTAYLQCQNIAQAKTHLRRSVELFPEQPLTLYNLAIALFAEGNGKAAVDELSNAVRIEKKYARGWYFKAQIESRLGRTVVASASILCATAFSSLLTPDEAQGLHTFIEEHWPA